jgi:hypothetical protein
MQDQNFNYILIYFLNYDSIEDEIFVVEYHIISKNYNITYYLKYTYRQK